MIQKIISYDRKGMVNLVVLYLFERAKTVFQNITLIFTSDFEFGEIFGNLGGEVAVAIVCRHPQTWTSTLCLFTLFCCIQKGCISRDDCFVYLDSVLD